MFKLADAFASTLILRPGEFAAFGTPDATEPGTLVFCENAEFLERASRNPNVSAILASEKDLRKASLEGKGLAATDSPRADYWRAFADLAESGSLRPAMEFGRGQGCLVHPTAVVSERAWLGDGVVIEAHATVGDYSAVASGTLIGPGARIGAEGMQSVRVGGRLILVRHAGGTHLGENSAVLANAIVQRAVHPKFTTVGKDTHISVLCSVGHQSTIGERCKVAGHCLIGGSVTIGDDVVIGPSATLKDGIHIGSRARIRMGSVVIEDVVESEDVSGNFAVGHVGRVRAYAKSKRKGEYQW